MNPLLPLAAIAALGSLIIASVATRVQLLPDVVDVTIIGTFAGYGGLAFTFYGAARRYHPNRVGRLAMLGQLLGAVLGSAVLAVGLIAS